MLSERERAKLVNKAISAILLDRLQALTRLIQQDPSIVTDGRDSKGRALIHVAAARSFSKGCLRYLLAQGADVNSRASSDQSTPLHVAISEDFEYSKDRDPVIQILLSNGALVDARNVKGETPLCLAARDGGLSWVKMLVERGFERTIKVGRSFLQH